MTGLGIGALLDNYIDELGSGFIDSSSKNQIFLKANYNVIEKKIQLFQANNKITTELQPLITKTAALTPINATLDLSPTSVTVPNYYYFIDLAVTSPFRGVNVTNYAKERQYSQFQSTYTEGDARYPRYYLSNGILTIEPADAVSAVLTYFITPQTIDVTDNSTEMLYNDKLIQLIIDEAMIIAGIKGRDQIIVQNETMMEQKNP